jgi:hypothetical protein
METKLHGKQKPLSIVTSMDQWDAQGRTGIPRFHRILSLKSFRLEETIQRCHMLAIAAFILAITRSKRPVNLIMPYPNG